MSSVDVGIADEESTSPSPISSAFTLCVVTVDRWVMLLHLRVVMVGPYTSPGIGEDLKDCRSSCNGPRVGVEVMKLKSSQLPDGVFRMF